ncbi:hypothetical protein QCA50_014927 [Cerrena zonata]|uniref:Uncharacterized protein n=1 Tax=Cerrena zonata TaxID=2478898 RepID=A0AAW0FSD3_9APHY
MQASLLRSSLCRLILKFLPPDIIQSTTLLSLSPPFAMTDTLRNDGLYIVLYLTSFMQEQKFHWALYHHYRQTGDATQGYRYHIRTVGPGWIADHGPNSGVMGSFSLITVVYIGTISQAHVNQVATHASQFDAQLNQIPSMTCRVWTMMVLQSLVNGHLLRVGGTVDQIEAEMKEIGAEHENNAHLNVQPRPIRTSKYAIL